MDGFVEVYTASSISRECLHQVIPGVGPFAVASTDPVDGCRLSFGLNLGFARGQEGAHIGLFDVAWVEGAETISQLE